MRPPISTTMGQGLIESGSEARYRPPLTNILQEALGNTALLTRLARLPMARLPPSHHTIPSRLVTRSRGGRLIVEGSEVEGGEGDPHGEVVEVLVVRWVAEVDP